MLIRPDSIYFNYRQGQAPPSPHRDPGRLNSPGEVSSLHSLIRAGEHPRHCSPFEPRGGDARGCGRMLEAGGIFGDHGWVSGAMAGGSS